MFQNAGGKIKVLAKICFWLVAIGGSILGIVDCGIDGPLGLLLIPGSILVGWLGSIALYAFGELCENTQRICEYAANLNTLNNGSTDPGSTAHVSNTLPEL